MTTDIEFESGVLRVACGPYAEGLAVTTDPTRPIDPKGEAPIFVDPQRFATWKASKVLVMGTAKTVAKGANKQKEELANG